MRKSRPACEPGRIRAAHSLLSRSHAAVSGPGPPRVMPRTTFWGMRARVRVRRSKCAAISRSWSSGQTSCPLSISAGRSHYPRSGKGQARGAHRGASAWRPDPVPTAMAIPSAGLRRASPRPALPESAGGNHLFLSRSCDGHYAAECGRRTVGYVSSSGTSGKTRCICRGSLEIPLVLFDRSFRKDGGLYYPVSGNPDAPWVSEYYGSAILVNGASFPISRSSRASIACVCSMPPTAAFTGCRCPRPDSHFRGQCRFCSDWQRAGVSRGARRE